MNEQQRFLMVSNRSKIASDLIVGDIFSYLQSKFVLTVDDIEIINNEIVSRKKAEKLISILLSKNKNVFNNFYNALKYGEYFHLAQLLEGEVCDTYQVEDSDSDTDDLPDIRTMLHDGGVPKLPQVYIQRKTELRKLRDNLHKLKPCDGWVILNGMGGSGKTLLAADSLNDENLVYSSFPGGIYWVNVGKVDDIRLLMKMQNLCRWLDLENIYQTPRNLEEAKDRLRILFLHEHPRSLLVLDDVWSAEVVKHFDVRVRTLVTTRYSGLVDKITGSIFVVPITEQLSLKDSQSVLTQYTGLSNLPTEANSIIENCKGYPLALCMIGALLKVFPNRWEYYLKQLQNQHLSKIKSKLSGSYSSLYDAIAINIESLSEEQKKYYQMLSVFDEDVPLSKKVLSIYFNMDEIEVEDIMAELIERSLISTNNDNDYQIHDLQLYFLKEKSVADNKLHEFHAEIIERYSLICREKFEMLEDDGYIHWYLLSHLLQADRVRQAVDLFCNLTWIERAAVITTPAMIIQSYSDIISAIKNKKTFEKDMKLLADLSRLISIQSHVLPAVSGSVNLTQIALTQSTSSEVYNLAKQHAIKDIQANFNNLYYDWINRPAEIFTDLILTIKPHNSAINCCQFAHNGNSSIVVSCGNDKKVMVWDSKSGNNVLTLEDHSDHVTCCVFTYDDKKIVSCSADCSIKIWSVDNGNVLLTLRGHTSDVLCCSVSHDNNYIVSASIDMTVKIWHLNSGLLYHTLTEHTDVVNWCCFSADSALIASASNDMYLKVFDVKTKEVLFTCGGDKDFVSYCVFAPDGTGLIGTSLNYIQSYSLIDGMLQWSIATPCDVLSVQYSRDTNYLVVANCDMTARLLDIDKKVFVQSFTGHSSWINDVSFCSDGHSIVVAGADGVAKTWAVNPLTYCTMKLSNVFDVSFFVENNPVTVVATNSGTVQLLRNDRIVRESEILGNKISCCVFSQDASHIGVGLCIGVVKLLITSSFKIKWQQTQHTDKINALQIGCRKLVSCSDDKRCVIYNLESGEVISCLTGHENILTKCLFARDEERVVTSSFDGNTVVWDSESGSEIFRFKHDGNAVTSCCVSPNEQLVATCTANNEAYIWSMLDGEKMTSVDDHDDVIRCVVFSPDGILFATGSDDGIAKIWRTSNGELVCECKSHDTWIVDMKFNDQSKILMTVSDNIKWFDLRGSLLQTYRTIGSYMSMVKSTPDFKTCITTDDLGYLYILKEIR